MSKRVIIAGGGTGGHIFPAVAVANALKKIDAGIEILFVGAKGKMEMEKVPQAGYKIEGLDIAGFNRSSLIKNIALPFKILKSFWQVRSIIKKFKPHAAFGVGGYSSYPVLRWAQVKGIPTFLHESNAFAGKSNILLGKKALKVFVATDNMSKFFPSGKIVVTGNPVRRNIIANTMDGNAAKASFGLDAGKTTLFVMGGSLGARSINEAIAAGLETIIGKGLQLVWQTGKPFAATAKNLTTGRAGIWAGDFINNMENAYAAADIVISRSGAMSVAELCIAGKPVVFVPYPFAAEDHQMANAKALADRGAALIVPDAEVKEKLVSTLVALTDDAERQAMLSDNIKKMAVVDADWQIANSIMENI